MAPERQAKVNEVIGEIRTFWLVGDKAKAKSLTLPLRAVITAELAARNARRDVHGQMDFEGKLRVIGS